MYYWHKYYDHLEVHYKFQCLYSRKKIMNYTTFTTGTHGKKIITAVRFEYCTQDTIPVMYTDKVSVRKESVIE